MTLWDFIKQVSEEDIDEGRYENTLNMIDRLLSYSTRNELREMFPELVQRWEAFSEKHKEADCEDSILN